MKTSEEKAIVQTSTEKKDSGTPKRDQQVANKPVENSKGLKPVEIHSSDPVPENLPPKEEYSIKENLKDEIQEQLTIIEGLTIKITDKKDERNMLQALIQPIPRAKRRQGVEPKLSLDKRKAAKLKIKQLNLEIFSYEEDLRTAMLYLTQLTNNDSVTLKQQILKERASSSFYLSRNKNSIRRNVAKLINTHYSENRRVIQALKQSALANGQQAIADFSERLFEFLRSNKPELYILCTGKEAFKQDILNDTRLAFRRWSPQENDFTL